MAPLHTLSAIRWSAPRTSITKPGAKIITINSDDLFIKGNYQDFQRFTGSRPRHRRRRRSDAALADRSREAPDSPTIASARCRIAARGWPKLHQQRSKARGTRPPSPGTPAPSARRACRAELWAQIQNEDWSLVGATTFVSKWPQRLWNFDKHYQYIGGAGGYGIGYDAPAAIGAALANRKHGRLTVNIQCDGDLMYAPGILWTAAHHKIPLLHVMHNNRAYHQEVMQVQIMADRHSRGVQNCGTGTTITGPDISYAKLAESMGMYGEGPITDPKDLGPAIRRAIDVVKRGEPALVDVVTQPR